MYQSNKTSDTHANGTLGIWQKQSLMNFRAKIWVKVLDISLCRSTQLENKWYNNHTHIRVVKWVKFLHLCVSCISLYKKCLPVVGGQFIKCSNNEHFYLCIHRISFWGVSNYVGLNYYIKITYVDRIWLFKMKPNLYVNVRQ